jgi:hypothetical protein
VKLVDLNLLLYAVNRDGAHHARAKRWLERTLGDGEPVGLPWAVLVGFLRLATSRRVFPKPLPPARALAVVDGWLARPVVVGLAPGDAHWRILRELLAESGTAGNLTTDAHLAALAIEHGTVLCSTDADFGRFRGLRWVNPLAGR